MNRASSFVVGASRVVAIALLAFVFVLGSSGASAATDDTHTEGACEGPYDFVQLPMTPPSAPRESKPWNILLYAAADIAGGQGFGPTGPFAASVASSPQANVLILEDQYSFIQEDVVWLVEHQPCSVCITPVLSLGEAETDEQETLEQFLRFAKEWFPSERTLLYMYGHGGAWKGACNDESNGTTMCGSISCDWLTPSEMRAAIEAVEGVDALMFAAPCAMCSLEAAYELRNVTELYVGSEELSGYLFWWSAVERIAASLEEDPDQDVFSLGEVTIDAIRDTMQEHLEADYYSHVVTRLPNIRR